MQQEKGVAGSFVREPDTTYSDLDQPTQEGVSHLCHESRGGQVRLAEDGPSRNLRSRISTGNALRVRDQGILAREVEPAMYLLWSKECAIRGRAYPSSFKESR